jgi:hypothetical protein
MSDETEDKPQVSPAVAEAAQLMASLGEELGRMSRAADEMRLDIVRQGQSIGGPVATSLAQLYGKLRDLGKIAGAASEAALSGKAPTLPAPPATPSRAPSRAPRGAVGGPRVVRPPPPGK